MSDQTQLLKIERHHLPSVAQVHLAAFPSSALTRLGIEVVRRYYDWQLFGPHDHEFVGLFHGQNLQGYAVGGISMGATGGFIKQNLGLLCWKVATHPWLIRIGRFRGRLRTALRVVFARRSRIENALPLANASSFGVLAIAVDPRAHGKGYGKLLMDKLESSARDRGFSRMHLTVAFDNAHAIAFYEHLAWRKSETGNQWNGRMEKQLASTTYLRQP